MIIVKKKKQCIKKLFLFSIPEYLCIVFNRFHSENSTIRKNKKFINFDQTLMLTKYVLDKSKYIGQKYTLKSIIKHTGEMKNGHYISVNKYNNVWFKCNDTKISKFQKINQENKKDAYILIYQKLS